VIDQTYNFTHLEFLLEVEPGKSVDICMSYQLAFRYSHPYLLAWLLQIVRQQAPVQDLEFFVVSFPKFLHPV
jgi:hypothetical protein